MTDQQIEDTVIEIESRIKTHILCTALLNLLPMPIEEKTRVQCHKELSKLGLTLENSKRYEIKRARKVLKKNRMKIIELKGKLSEESKVLYRRRLSWFI